MLSYFILILLWCIAILFSYYQYFKDHNLRKFSGPFPLPFIGNVLLLNDTPENVWLAFLDTAKKYGSTFRLWYFSNPLIVLTDPKDVKVLLSCKRNVNKADFGYKFMSQNIGDDELLFGRDEMWRKRRKLISPAFAPQLLKIYSNTSIEHVEKLVSFIKSQGNEAAIDLKSTILMFTFKILCEAVMGFDLDSRSSSEAELFRKQFDEYNEIAYYRTCRPYIQDWMVPFLNIYQRQKQAIHISRSFSNQIIKERREKKQIYSYKNFVNNDIKSEACKQKLSFLDLLLSAEADNLIDEQGIQDEVQVFLIAGHETSGVTLIFTLMLLAENKNAQDLAWKEISSIMDENGGKLNLADITKLNYVERCIKEAMRLYPSILMFGRRITEELQLSTSELILPVNSDIIVFAYAIHRNPKYWPHPEKFDPDRFLPEQVQNRPLTAYLPFSFGIRNCIAYKFAMLEMKVAVANILYNFEVQPINRTADVRMTFRVPLTLSDSLYAKFIKRR